MYFLSALYSDQVAYFASINSTDKYLATASADGNITVRAVKKFTDLIPKKDAPSESVDAIGADSDSKKTPSPDTTEISETKPTEPTQPLSQMQKPPMVDKAKFQRAQAADNLVFVKTRSKVIALRYANTTINDNLLVALYKNGDVYLIENPESRDKCKLTHLFKHDKDSLVDVSWSADDQLLAISSVNDEVIIYDVFYRKILTTIKFNTDEDPAIKGVAFDKNMAQYLLVLKDDRSVSILNYTLADSDSGKGGRDFKYDVLQTISSVTGKNKLNKATIRRVSWSMDGEVFSIPNSSKGKFALLSLFHRDTSPPTAGESYSSWCALVGHGFKCTMTQFSPIVYKNELYNEDAANQRSGEYKYSFKNEKLLKEDSPNNKAVDNRYSYILATASSDSTVAIWNTSCEAPLLIANEVCSGPIQDMVWSNDGKLLFIASAEGDLMMGVVDHEELGTPVKEINNQAMNEKAAEIAKSIEHEVREWQEKQEEEKKSEENKKTVVQEEKKEKEKKEEQKEDPVEGTPLDGASGKTKAKGKGKVTDKVEDGETPPTVVKPKANKASNNKPLNTPSVPETTTSSVVNGKSVLVANDLTSLVKSKSKASKNGSVTTTNTVTTMKNGKKRIQPMLISSDSNGKQSYPSIPEVSSNNKRGISTMEFDAPSYAVSKELSNKVNRMNRTLNGEANEMNGSSGNTTKKQKRDIEPLEFIGSVVLNPSTSFSNVRISTAKVRSWISLTSSVDESVYLEVKNGNGSETAATRVALLRKVTPVNDNDGTEDPPLIKQIFVDFIPNRVHLVTGGEGFFWALSTVSGQVIVYSDSGRTLLPPLVLGSPLSFLESKNQYLMAVTSLGELFVWDVVKKKSLYSQVSLYSLLQPIYRSSAADQNGNSSSNVNGVVFFHGDILARAENLTMCSITSTGIPIVTLTNGNGYLYNHDLGSWTLISDTWWAFGSQYWDSTSSLGEIQGSSGNGIIGVLESHTNEEITRKGKAKLFAKISKVMMMKEGYENLETVISLNHLENKLLTYEILNDSKNFRSLFLTYTKRLSQIPMKGRLDEICKELLLQTDGSGDKICGISKHELLRDVVLSCSHYREVQRILSQYAASVDLIDDDLLV